MRGIRGAICAEANTRDAIYTATQHLLHTIMERNDLTVEDISAAWFTMTPDLDADFPAYAARDMGWTDVPMLGAQESAVPGAHERAIRVLLMAHGEGPARHVYVGDAAAMRPDLAEPEDAVPLGGSGSGGGGAAGEGESGGRGRLAIIGLGLIGGSLAAAASQRKGSFTEIVGFDRSPDATARAEAWDLIDRAASDLEDAVASADLVVLAVPVRQILELLPRIGGAMRPGSVVTDVGSTKRRIVEMMDRLPDGVHGIGGHPMTGRTGRPPLAPDPGLFRGASWAIVGPARTNAAAQKRVKRLIRAVGARPVEMSAEVHDRVVGLSSHLPALVAVALTESAAGLRSELGGHPFLWGPGFASATRLADAEPEMAAEMLADNVEHVAAALERFDLALDRLRAGLRDRRRLVERLASVRDLRSTFSGGGISPASSPADY